MQHNSKHCLVSLLRKPTPYNLVHPLVQKTWCVLHCAALGAAGAAAAQAVAAAAAGDLSIVIEDLMCVGPAQRWALPGQPLHMQSPRRHNALQPDSSTLAENLLCTAQRWALPGRPLHKQSLRPLLEVWRRVRYQSFLVSHTPAWVLLGARRALCSLP